MKNTEEKKYCIYVLENKINGKKYYGQSCNYKNRMSAYKRLDCKKQPKLYNAILKYGWDNFESRVIVDNLNLVDANELEIYFIKLKNTTVTGYNISIGGGAFLGIKGRKAHNKHLNDIQEKEIVEKYKENKLSVYTLAELYNCSITPIIKALNKNNCKIRGAKIFTDAQYKEICEFYKTGISSLKLAEMYKCSKHTILEILHKYKCKLRDCKKFTDFERLDMLLRHKNGESYRSIGRFYNAHNTTVISIVKTLKNLNEETLSLQSVLN